MRLIDADVAIEELTDRSHQAAKRVGTDSPFWEGLVIARRIVNNLPTIQPEKAQLSQEGTTSDTISRQAAIDALQKCRKHCIDPFDSYHIDIQDAENQLSKLPTIQPVATDTNVGNNSEIPNSSDCISRQQALDAVGKYASVWMEYTDAMSKDEIAQIALNNAKSTMIRILKELPSAQPEPHEGHWIEGGIYRDVIECNCSECGQLMTTAATVRMNFCPNCGAKMKGATT